MRNILFSFANNPKVVFQRVWHILAIFLILVSNLGTAISPAKAFSDLPSSAKSRMTDLQDRNIAPAFSRPQERKIESPSQASAPVAILDQTNAIACIRAAQHNVFDLTVSGCDSTFQELLHIHEDGLGNNIYFHFVSPNNQPVYFVMKANYHIVIHSPEWLPNLVWFARNPLITVDGKDSIKGTGAYEYISRGNINPSWWGGFEVRHDIAGHPYDTMVIDSIDMYFSLTPIPEIPVESTLANCCTAYSQALAQVGDPINTRTGGFNFPVTDLSIPTSAGLLVFQRRYFSQAKDRYTEPLGIGWTHNQDIRLIFPTDPAGDPRYTLFKDAIGNIYRFTDTGNGSFKPYPGFTAVLSRSQGTPVIYTLEDAQHIIYTFNEGGKVQTKTDLTGRRFNFEYDINERLNKVSASGDTNFISLGYDSNGMLNSIIDQSDRGVSLNYDSRGDLVSATDVLGNNWYYIYDLEHNLLKVTDKNDVTIVRNDYVSPVKTIVDFNDHTITAYGTGGSSGTTTIEDSGQTLHLEGDIWDKVEISYPITDQTILEFDFRSTVEGDIHAIGLDEDNIIDWSQTFKLYGDKQFGITTYNNYAGAASAWKHYKIRLDGVPHTTNGSYLYFVNDHDIAVPIAESYFSNIQIYETISDGKIAHQYNGSGNLVAELAYNADGTTTITDGLGNIKTHIYSDIIGTLENITNTVTGSESSKTYDSNYRPVSVTAGGNTTYLEWSDDGQNLELIKDAEGNQTHITYDSLNNPTLVLDANQNPTSYEYTNSLLTKATDALNGVTRYTYTTTGYIETIIDPFGNVTKYEYNLHGESIKVISNYDQATYPISDGLHNLITSYAYNEFGQVIDVIAVSGTKTHNEYNAAGRLTKCIQNVHTTSTYQNYEEDGVFYNTITQYRYDARGNQIAVVDTNNVVTRTYYDGANRPVSIIQNLVVRNDPDAYEAAILIDLEDVPPYDITYPDRNSRSDTVYDDAGNAIAAIDPHGVITRTYYDYDNRPVAVVQNLTGQAYSVATIPSFDPAHPDQNVRTETIYDPVGNVIATKDMYGMITRTYYNALNRPVIIIKNLSGQSIATTTPPERGTNLAQTNLRTDLTYDILGNTIAITDPLGRTTRTYYDALNRPITEVQNLVGQAFSLETPPAFGTGDQNVRMDTYYDSVGRAYATVDPLGHVTRTWYDPAGRALTVVRNLTQDINIETIPDRTVGAPDENLRADTEYDASGRRISSTDALGHVTRYLYTDSGQLTQTIVNPLDGQADNYQNLYNLKTTYTYDALGRVLTTTDAKGRVTASHYDQLGRTDSTTRNFLSAQSEKNYQNQYNITTLFMYSPDGAQIAITDPLGMVTRTYQDALGRTISIVRNISGSDIMNGNIPARGTGEINLRTDSVYDGSGHVTAAVNEAGKTTNVVYDALGRQHEVSDPLSNTTHSEYDAIGRLVESTDANGAITKYEYDALGNLTGVVENSSGPTDEQIRTEYTYNSIGNRITITDGNGHTSHFIYDKAGRLKNEIDPLGHNWEYGYDKDGNQTSILDANQKTTLYRYDQLNRLDLIDYAGSEANVSFTYDEVGRRTSMLDGLGTTTWQYDNLDRPVSVTDPFDKTVRYTYNALGNRATITYPPSTSLPAGKVVTYDYDSAHRLKTAINDGLPLASYQIDAVSRVKVETLANGVTTNYAYDDAGRLLSIVHSKDGQTLASFQYPEQGGYDAVGNRKIVIENMLQLVTASPTSLPSATATEIPTSTQTDIPIESPTIELTATDTQVPAITLTATPTESPTATMTTTDTVIATPIDTPTETQTVPAVETSTESPTPTETWMPVFTETPAETATNTPAIPGIVDRRVSASGDDAEEHNSDGSIYLSSSVLKLGDAADDIRPQTVGLRFNNISIPQGAILTNAYLEFTVGEVHDESTSLAIYLQSDDDAQAFTNTAYDLANRTRTSALVVWNDIPVWDIIGSVQTSPDLSSILQEVLNRQGWVSGNSVAFLVEGSGWRTVYAWDGSEVDAPLLHIEYITTPLTPTQTTSTPTATGTTTQTQPTSTVMATETPTPTQTPFSVTVTETPTLPPQTYTPVATATVTLTKTATLIPTKTATPSFTPTKTGTPTPTALPTSLPDDSFEDVPSKWTGTMSSPATWLLHGTGTGLGGPYSGNYGYAISNNPSGYLSSDAIVVTQNLIYNVSAWVRGELDDQQGLGGWFVSAFFYNSSDTLISYITVATGAESSISEIWKQVSGTVTAPAGAVTMKIRLYNTLGSGWVAFDDISVIKTGATINLVTNPGFESAGNWVTTATAPGTWFLRNGSGESAPHSGTYGYSISNSAAGHLDSSAFTAAANTQYNVSAWVRGELDDKQGVSGESGWYLRAVFYNSSGAQISFADADSGAGASITPTWQQVSGTVTSPSGTTSMKIWLMNTQTSGWVAFDDISVIQAGAAINLVTNPGFESAGSWTTTQTSPGTWFWRSTAGTEGGPHTGTYGYVITNNVYGNLTSGSFSAQANSTYAVGAWLRGELVDNQGIGGWILRAVFYNSSGTLISYTNAASGGGASVTPIWKQVSGLVTAPVGTTSMRIVLYNYQTSGWVTFDDVYVLEGIPLSPNLNLEPNLGGSPAEPSDPTAFETLTPTQAVPSGPITITYVYDKLNRLTEANYSDGRFYHYTYDKVGNRETVTDQYSTTVYDYDDANRLMSVDGVAYTWDNNGNLLSDGVNTYTYDSANRLISFESPSGTASYRYNGLGDRLQETVNGQTTTFTMDLAAGLTQTLDDGAHAYLYGNDRIAQVDTTGAEYFLGDALGSVRQLTDAAGAITLARTYDPYGVQSATSGAGATSYGFTDEYQDSYIKLIYLRSRYVSPETGRFLTRDSWQGNYNRPGSLNRWNYAEGNPINLTDPSGNAPIIFTGLENCFELANDATLLAYHNGNNITVADYRGMCIAEWAMSPNPSDYINTYVAAGVAIESNFYNPAVDTRGSLWFWWKGGIGVGLGICNISDAQMETPAGKPAPGGGYGLGLRDGIWVLGKPDQEDPKIAVEGMRQRILQVLEPCKKCSSTDEFIAAALAEGGNLNKNGVATLISDARYKRDANEPIQNIFKWGTFMKDGVDYDHNLRQVRLFLADILELRKRNLDWYVPADISWQYITDLGNGVAK